MTEEQVKHLLIMINATYPNFKVDDVKATVTAWHFLLSDYDSNDISIAFKTFVCTSGGSFPPSVAELIAMTHKPAEMAQMSAQEAWTIVRRCISRGNYYAQRDFDALPSEEIKKAVGSSEQIKIWASDSDFNEGVESSNFYKRYNTELKRSSDLAKMPKEAKALIGMSQGLKLEEK